MGTLYPLFAEVKQGYRYGQIQNLKTFRFTARSAKEIIKKYSFKPVPRQR